MGSNRPPSWDVINEVVIRPAPITLSDRERGFKEFPPEAPAPIEVEAWVRFPETAIKVQGRAVAWTDRVVWVEFTLRSGVTHRVWVWASAVARR